MRKQYLFTERAHLMCPNMNFGIAAEIAQPFSEGDLKCAMEAEVAAHPFLSAVLGYEADTNRYYYDVTSESKVEMLFKDEPAEGIYDRKVLQAYKALISVEWDLRREGFLKAVFWKSQSGTVVLFVFHHLLADGRGALSLAEEFADCYIKNRKPERKEEVLISDVNEFPKNSRLPFISRLLIDNANRNGAKEGKVIGYDEYRDFANDFLKKDDTRYAVVCEKPSDTQSIVEVCRQNQVSVNDYLMAKMFMEDGTDKIVIAGDLRSRLACYVEGALGNYSTAFSVVCKKKGEDIIQVAKVVHELVAKKLATPAELYLVLQCYARLRPSVLDAAAISALGGFESKAGKFIGSMFFGFAKPTGYSITNLGKVESETIRNAMFIPPASPAMKKTQGIITVNGNMNICTCER